MKRSLAAVSLALLGFACSPRACGETKEKPVYRLVSDSQIKFTRPEPRSAECPHASSSRAGRVAVAPHALAGLTAIASVEDGPWAHQAPRFLDLPEGTGWLVLERPSRTTGGLDVRTPAGALAFARETTSSGSHVLARPQRYYVDAAWHAWSGTGAQTRAEGYLSPSGELLACAMRGEEGQTLVATPSGPDHSSVLFIVGREECGDRIGASAKFGESA